MMGEDRKRRGLALVQGAATELRDEIAELQELGERLAAEQRRIELEVASLAAEAVARGKAPRSVTGALSAMLAKLRGKS